MGAMRTSCKITARTSEPVSVQKCSFYQFKIMDLNYRLDSRKLKKIESLIMFRTFDTGK
jgi:hypothetical protein